MTLSREESVTQLTYQIHDLQAEVERLRAELATVAAYATAQTNRLRDALRELDDRVA